MSMDQSDDIFIAKDRKLESEKKFSPTFENIMFILSKYLFRQKSTASWNEILGIFQLEKAF